MMQIERQRMWGWIVAFYIFLAGVGGGTFLFSFILNITGIYEPVARIGALVGPLLVLLGTFFLDGTGSLDSACIYYLWLSIFFAFV
jgi:formate-dependent nitrite reductase membrane component NrfD